MLRENVTMKEKVTLNKKEQRRLVVLNQVEVGRMRGDGKQLRC